VIIKKLKKKEYSKLASYLDKYYRKGHILSKNRKLFDWMYYDKKSKKYNFLVAQIKNRIIATKGFQPLRRYDEKLSSKEFFMSMWSSSVPTAGIKLFNQLIKKKNKFIGGIGSSKQSYTYQKYNNFFTGIMRHSYLLSSKIKKFQIAKVIKIKKSNKKNIYGSEYFKIDINFLKKNDLSYLFAGQIPKKSPTYIINRYLESPFYKYYAFGALINKKIVNIVVLRNCFYKKKIAVRIVDYIGCQKYFKYLDVLFKKILNKNNVEYIDLYSHGISFSEIKKSGLIIKDSKDSNIIPNLFEPFKKINHKIIYGYLCDNKNRKKVKFFKGDSDMDRPNII